jgi:3alpha(or 20beta)-hydroxysteroid dehydrogenase
MRRARSGASLVDTRRMGRLDGKVALISGGARGQGAAEARLFAAEGAKVMVGDVLDDEGGELARELSSDQCAYRHHDVTDESQWAAMVTETLERFGRLDILVNNAGVFRILPMMQTSLEDYRRINDINQIGVFLGMQAVTPSLVERGGGSIINISSIAGLRGSPASFAYSASKWAVRGMTKCAALELAPFKVRVNSIHPGIIDTPMAQEFVTFGVWDTIRERIPMGDVAAPEEVARLALFLASDDSTYCTGAEFIVDGGMTTGL